MMSVLFSQQCGVRSLRKLALLINKCQDIQRLHSNQFQSLLVVNKLNVLPVYVFVVVLVLRTIVITTDVI